MGYQYYHFLPAILNRDGRDDIHFEAIYILGATLGMQVSSFDTKLTEKINMKATGNSSNAAYTYMPGSDRLGISRMPNITVREKLMERQWDIVFMSITTYDLYRDQHTERLQNLLGMVRDACPSAKVIYMQPSSHYETTAEVTDRLGLPRNPGLCAYETAREAEDNVDRLEREMLSACSFDGVLEGRRIFNVIKRHPRLYNDSELTWDLHHVDGCTGMFILSLILYRYIAGFPRELMESLMFTSDRSVTTIGQKGSLQLTEEMCDLVKRLVFETV